jgi:pimeloyl-ACP methyl ester carboxylesterase
MRHSESIFLDIRGLRYHVRRWRHPGGPKVVLLHGWMDVSASFQFLVDELRGEWDVHAPDWRGYGLTDWAKADCYWFPDYLADLDFILQAIDADAPVSLVGHSLGGKCRRALCGNPPGARGQAREPRGLRHAAHASGAGAGRYGLWLDELHERPQLRPYATFAELEARLRAGNPRLTAERAHYLARHWGREEPNGSVVLRGDPSHKIVNPQLYRSEEAVACWQQVTAPVLWVEGAESGTIKRMKIDPAHVAERRAAFRNLRYATVPDAGHMLHHDQPHAVAALIEEFLGG